MDRLLRLREPATGVALVGLGLHVLLNLAAALTSGIARGNAAGLAAVVVDPLLLLLVAALALGCRVRPVTTHAVGLARAALALALLSLLASVVLLGLAAYLGGPGILALYAYGSLPRLVAAVLAVGILVTLSRRPVAALPGPEPVPELPPVAAEPEPEPADPQLEPAWTPDAAVGTVWRRAGDAGSTRPDTSWDAPGETHPWWGAAPNAGPAAEPPRHPEP